MEEILKKLLGDALGAILGRWLWIGLGVYVLGIFFWMLYENPNALEWGTMDGKQPPPYLITSIFFFGGSIGLLKGLWSGSRRLFETVACLLLGIGVFMGYKILSSAGVF